MRLKKRISGGRGHISNIQALELFKKHKAGYMNHLLLGHLSKINNRPELVEQLYQSFQDDLTIVIASRDKESSLFEIDHPVRGKIIPLSLKKESKQLDLFYQD